MATWAIGDIQGCYYSLKKLLKAINWGTNDCLIVLGDAINRGVHSLEVVRFLKQNEDRINVILGNHDLHFLACAAKVRQTHRKDTLDELYDADDYEEIVTWLRHRPLALHYGKYLCVHAGVLPNWTAQQTLAYASEVAQQLRGSEWRAFLKDVFGNCMEPFNDSLEGALKWRGVINVLSRTRFLKANGMLDFDHKTLKHPPELRPWFEPYAEQEGDTVVLFGHWASLGLHFYPNKSKPRAICLDSGCGWNGSLSALRLEDAKVVAVTADKRDLSI